MQDIQRTSGAVAKTTKQDDSTIIRSGVHHLPADFWDHNDCGENNGKNFTVEGSIAQAVMVNEFLVSGQGMNHIPRTSRVVKIVDDVVTLEKVDDYLNRQSPKIYGIKPKNSEQNLAINLLMDREIDIVTILGRAGSGKTLLALATALQQVEDGQYSEIIFTRANILMGRDSGFLPGNEVEKQMPLMGGMLDNLRFLVGNRITNSPSKKGVAATSGMSTYDILGKILFVKDMSLMRGRSFMNTIVIFDEFQNNSPKQAKALITRIGKGSKVVCLGNLSQIDTPNLTAETSGLTHLANKFASWPHAGHIILNECTRSRLAGYAEDVL